MLEWEVIIKVIELREASWKMSEESKKFNVEIDASSYEVIKEVSRDYNYEDQEIVNYIVKNSLKEYIRIYNEMKNGYMEMGKINLEISNAFAVSENEALNYID